MYNSKIEVGLFVKNRAKLMKMMLDNSMIIIFSSDECLRNGDQLHKYRQNSDLLYLTGINQEKTILLISKVKNSIEESLFILKPNEKMEIWNGHKLSINEAKDISGIKDVKFIDEFEKKIDTIVKNVSTLYLDIKNTAKTNLEYVFKELRFLIEFEKSFPNVAIEGVEKILHSLRTVKEPEEIDLIKQACSITENAFRKVLKIVKPNLKEYEVEAEITYEFNKNGAGHAYLPIVASGINACTLHYVENDKICKDGNLLLMDFGAEYANYAADCSRTIPINGKFSPRQLECYNAVLRVFKEARKLFISGNTIEKINAETNKMMESEMIKLGLFTAEDVKNQEAENPLFRKYFMHGTSHFLGLDVHDVGNKTDILQKGMVLTCEPGLYIKEEEIGIRIENNIFIDDEPIDLMANIPIEADEIERLMSEK